MPAARAMRLAEGVEPFPGYRLAQFLGRGGWGEVWKALRPDDQALALKFLWCNEGQAAAAQEVRALQAVRQLKHPHLIHIEQIWVVPGYVVIAMELADANLLDLLDTYQTEFQQPIVAEHVCFYLAQAADAIDFMNARKHTVSGQRVAFRHCDVKPSNLLLRDTTVKLADFSLAVQTTSPMWYHRRKGTLAYAAPEVFQGWLSDKTDQYALAVTYCQLRTGRLPFPEAPREFTKDYVRPEPDLSQLVAGERTILHRALNPVPQDRWPSCLEMMHRLADCLSEAAVPA